MILPGFTAEASLYPARRSYRTAGFHLPAENSVLPAMLTAERPNEFGVDLMPLVLPMSVPGHKSDQTGACQGCKGECLGIEAGCDGTVLAGCSPALAIPFIGGFVYAGCVAVGAAACAAALGFCVSQCENIGGACCPVACGVGCCNRTETCLDTSNGLCCSAGTLPCPGPMESCYDPKKEKCLPSGVGCPGGQECGYNCCGEYAVCVDPNSGTCCGLLTGIPCGTSCCDGGSQQCTDTGCCPTAQACGSTCCPPGFVCNANGQCVEAQACQPGQFLCVSADKTKQNCCAGDQVCCIDGSCCGGASNSDLMCCGSLGCVPSYNCIG
jgi:hypothetical protein